MDLKVDLEKLTAEERLVLLGDIWDSLDPDDVPVTEAQRAEIDRRLEDLDRDPQLGIPWEELLRRLRGQSA